MYQALGLLESLATSAYGPAQGCSSLHTPLRLRLRTRDEVGYLRVKVAEEVGYVVNEEHSVIVAKEHPLIAVVVQLGMGQEGSHGCSAVTG